MSPGVPWGYLVGVGFVALATVFALWPVRRPVPISTVSYYLGLVTAELPLVACAGLLVSTGLALSQGDIAGPVGAAGLVLAVLAAAGLVAVLARALRAADALDRALADAGIDPGRPRRPAPLLRALRGPVVVRPRSVERIGNLPYGPAGRRNLLDVYRHRARPAGAPVFVYFHGGGYFSGGKRREARPLLHRLASQGWVCVSATYRLRPAAGFAGHLEDAKRTLAWAHEHGRSFGGDPSRIVVAGSSAGGHLASICALTQDDPRFQPSPAADTSVCAAVGLYGYYGPYYGTEAGTGTGGGAPSTPLEYLRPDAPPFFLVHGDRDTYVPPDAARELARALRATSRRPVGYAELPGAHHAFDLFHSVRSEAVVDAVEAFCASVAAPAGSRRHRPPASRRPEPPVRPAQSSGASPGPRWAR